MLAIFKREFKSYFNTPIGYIYLAAVYFFLGLLFHSIYAVGDTRLNLEITSLANIIIYILPILTMRLMSEDRKQRVDQILLTAPVKLTSIVLGKFLAAMAVFAIGLAPTVIFEAVLAANVENIQLMYYIYSLIGIMLLGGALVSIGMFISSLTESTAISAILSLVINILVAFDPYFASMIKIKWLSTAVDTLSFLTRFENFSENIFSIADIIYFLSNIAIFVFLSIRSLEKKRSA